MAKQPDVIVSVVREYEVNGEKRKFFTKVGVGFVTDKGCWLRIEDGISISGGSVYVGPPKESGGNADADPQT